MAWGPGTQAPSQERRAERGGTWGLTLRAPWCVLCVRAGSVGGMGRTPPFPHPTPSSDPFPGRGLAGSLHETGGAGLADHRVLCWGGTSLPSPGPWRPQGQASSALRDKHRDWVDPRPHVLGTSLEQAGEAWGGGGGCVSRAAPHTRIRVNTVCRGRAHGFTSVLCLLALSKGRADLGGLSLQGPGLFLGVLVERG